MENTPPDTSNFLNWVEIKNFKSIKDLRFDCKRVNVFIGKPNVGKSNILEGLGLLGAGYDTGKFLTGTVRYNKVKELYRDNDVGLSIEVLTDKQEAIVRILPTLNLLRNGQTVGGGVVNFSISGSDGASRRIDELGEENWETPDDPDRREKFNEQFRKVKKYDFANLAHFEIPFQDYLLPPNGQNLYSVVRRNQELWTEFANLFTEQQLELVLYDEKQEIILQKKNGPLITQYPFFSIADTFRRFMFYITAIESNKNSVLIFEEPEVHSFPPYIQNLAFRMVESTTNQFFVATHSPYLLQTLISNLKSDELNVFITYYEDYETKVRLLTEEDLGEVQESSLDLFYNLRLFQPKVNA